MAGLTLGGLVSGMDTEDVIYKLMQIERRQVTVQEDRQEALEAKQKAWREVRTALSTIQSKLDPLRMPTVYQSRKVTLSDESVASITAASGAAQTSYTLKVEQLAQSHVVTQREGSEISLDTKLTAGSFQIGNNPENLITVTEDDTLQSLASQINKKNLGVRADLVTVSEGKYRLVLTSLKSGESNAIQLHQTEGSAVLQELGLLDDQGAFTNVLSQAQDAQIYLNGQLYKSATNSFDNILPGISITAKKPSSDTVSATVTIDTDKIVQTVKDWVNAVNSLQDQLKKLSAYDSEKKTSGVLNGESLVRSMQHYLRQPFATKVEGLPDGMNLLSDIGVSTGAYGSADYGKIVVDEQKLRGALERDTNGVALLFNINVEAVKNDDGTVKTPAQKGLAVQMNDYIKSLLDVETGAVENRDKSLTEQIDRIKDTIERIELQLEKREEVLRLQFTRMEEALSKLQSQGNFIATQMLGLTNQS